MPKRTLGNIGARPKRKTFLREWRIFRGLKQSPAADAIGIERSALSKLERGVTGYNQAFIESAATAYGCEPGDLLSSSPHDVISQEGHLRAVDFIAATLDVVADFGRVESGLARDEFENAIREAIERRQFGRLPATLPPPTPLALQSVPLKSKKRRRPT